jgi:hypothetical protein
MWPVRMKESRRIVLPRTSCSALPLHVSTHQHIACRRYFWFYTQTSSWNSHILKTLSPGFILRFYIQYFGRDSSVGIEIGYMMGGRGIGFRFREGAIYFSLLHKDETGSGAHPVGTRGSLPGRKAYHSPPSRVKVKNGGSMPPLPHTSSCRGA